MSQTQQIPLTPLESQSTSLHTLDDSERALDADVPSPPPGTRVVEALDSYPDGGFEAWLQVFCCFTIFMVSVGGVYSWGVMDALVGLASTSTIAYIGSCQAAMVGFLAIPMNRLVRSYGPRPVALFGSACVTLGPILGSWCTHSLPLLFLTEGLLYGLGQACMFFAAATLPSSYFLKRRNLATGITFAGGGIGGALFSILSGVLLDKLGVPMTLRILGAIFCCVTFPSAFLLKSRVPKQPFRAGPIVDWAMFKDLRFVLVFAGTSIGLFPLFVPPFFLPLYASSLGLSSLTGSLLLAGFNLASAAGRIGFGLGADRLFGSVNSLVICLALVGITTLAIWPLATTLPPLVVYSVLNGFCSGGFFSLAPGVISSFFGSSKLSVIYGMLVSAWAPGYFLSGPIAGFILTAFGGAEAGVKAFRPAILYAGGLSMLSCALVLAARLMESKVVRKKL